MLRYSDAKHMQRFSESHDDQFFVSDPSHNDGQHAGWHRNQPNMHNERCSSLFSTATMVWAGRYAGRNRSCWARVSGALHHPCGGRQKRRAREYGRRRIPIDRVWFLRRRHNYYMHADERHSGGGLHAYRYRDIGHGNKQCFALDDDLHKDAIQHKQ